MKYANGLVTETSPIKISGGRLDGTVIDDTAIYVEITFTVRTFPGFGGFSDIQADGTQRVTVSRLIDIELNDNLNKTT
jgi:hypothetical protein